MLNRCLLSLILILQLASCTTTQSPKKKKNAAAFSTINLGAVWNDGRRCLDAVKAGRRVYKNTQRIRVATWNIKWFPDGTMREGGGRMATDVTWAACIVAYLNADVVALQEIKTTVRGRQKMYELLAQVDALTGGAWQSVTDSCEEGNRQHMVLLYDKKKVDLSAVQSYGEIDPGSKSGGTKECPGWLRPALGAYVKSRTGGVDFHLLNIHLDSGRAKEDLANRKRAWNIFTTLYEQGQNQVKDEDLIIAGDYNSMGCENCSELRTGDAERVRLAETMGKQNPPLKLMAPEHACSHYYKGKPGLLDHFTVSRAMQEANASMAKPLGLCAKARCRVLGRNASPIQSKVSDHCPVVFDIVDQDLD